MSLKSKLRQAVTVARDSRWWPFYLQRRFLHPQRRSALAGRLARWRGGTRESSPQDAQARIASHALLTEGIADLGKLLDRAQCEALVDYFSALEVFDPYRAEAPRFRPLGEGRHPNAHIAHHDPLDIVRAPALMALANRKDILAAVELFLGCKPTLAYLAAWWSYATPVGAQQAEFFHRDVDDWRFVKLFVYLTDVGPDQGPHVYVARSSSSPVLAQIRRFTDDEVSASFAPEQILTMTGNAGGAFLEDTFGLHKGQPVANGQRLIFQAVYSMNELPYGPRRAVLALEEAQRIHADTELDGWINRCYLGA